MLHFFEWNGSRELFVPVGPDQAHLLAHEFHDQPTRYAVTCGLIEGILESVGARITTLRMRVGRERTVMAEVELEAHERLWTLPADMGDVALLAHRLSIPILVSAALVKDRDLENEEVIQRFRRFLEHTGPEAFARSGQERLS